MRRRGFRGYTVVELLMALTVLALGASGVVAMQRVTLESNRYAKNLAIATRVGEAWTEQLEADAARWTALSPLSNTTWLSSVGACSLTAAPVGWFEPTWSATRKFGPAFDALGNPVDPTTNPPDSYTQFCAHVRLAWLHCENSAAAAANGVVRAEVRVFWRREDDTTSSKTAYQASGKAALCDPTAADAVTQDIIDHGYNSIYFTTAIREVRE